MQICRSNTKRESVWGGGAEKERGGEREREEENPERKRNLQIILIGV